MSDIKKVTIDLQTRLRNFKKEVGHELLNRVASRTPVDTGHLINSWELTMKLEAIQIENTAEYASFVENGTPHMAPRRMLALSLEELPQICEEVRDRLGLNK